MEKALLDITARAAARGARALRGRPPAQRFAPSSVGNAARRHAALTVDREKHAETHQDVVVHRKITILDDAAIRVEQARKEAALDHRLQSIETAGDLASPMNAQDVLQRLQVLPYPYATEALGVLLRAGHTDEALQLALTWHPADTREEKHCPLMRSPSLSSKRRVTKELRNTVHTLAELRDAQTLRVLAEILECALHEQAQRTSVAGAAVKDTSSASSADGTTTSVAFIGFTQKERQLYATYKLLTPLGARRTYMVLVDAVEALCGLDTADGVYTQEKIAWLSKAARARAALSTGDDREAMLPLRLQRVFTDTVETDLAYSESLARGVDPRFESLFRHPSQCTLETVLSFPVTEVKDILHTEELSAPRPQKENHHSLRSLLARFLPQSQTLRIAERNRVLLSAVARGDTAVSCAPDLVAQSRQAIIEKLRHGNRSDKRILSALLLRRPQVLKRLGLSPVTVLSIHGGSFYTVKQPNPRLSRLSLNAIPLLVRRGQDRAAAQLAWNHLSVCSSVTRQLLKARPQAMDAITVAICRAMRQSRRSYLTRTGQQHKPETWMAHRSLALLREAAAANVVCPLHVMVIGACALDQGAAFATVKDVVDEIYSTDCNSEAGETSKEARGHVDETTSRTAHWVLNCIRVCAACQDEPVRVHLTRRSLSARVKAFFQGQCADTKVGGSSTFMPMASPSRSKQLALWSLVNDPAPNPCLLALMTAVFLDPAAREAFLNCDGLVETHPSTKRVASTRSTSLQQSQNSSSAVEQPSKDLASAAARSTDEVTKSQHAASRFQSWEVAASIASNCSSDATYECMLLALSRRTGLASLSASSVSAPSPSVTDPRVRLHSLLRAEIDSFEEHPASSNDSAGGTTGAPHHATPHVASA